MPTAVAVRRRRRRRCCTGRMQDDDPRRRPPVTFNFPLLHLDGCNGDTGDARVAGGRGRAGGQAESHERYANCGVGHIRTFWRNFNIHVVSTHTHKLSSIIAICRDIWGP